MSYCQNCGTEVVGNFCSNCGTEVGGYNQTNTRVYENVKIVPRYSTGACVLAGYPGMFCLIGTLFSLVMVIVAIVTLPEYISTGTIGIALNYLLVYTIAFVILAFLTYLCYRPGLKSIRKYSPEGTAGRTRRGFFVRSFLFLGCWAITIVGCMYIIGLFLRVWRIGLWAATPRCDEYTAIIDGQNIGVTKYVDTTLYGDGKVRYIYQDEDGNLYRPPLYGK